MKVTLIKADGTVSDVASDRKLSLEEMQKLVGGYIERVRISGGEMYVDEEGLIKQLPLNLRASMLAGRELVGNALVFTRKVRGAKVLKN